MEVATLDHVESFTTKDGSAIRELHHSPAQSLAEATLAPGQATILHHHRVSEEIYFVLDGTGLMELDGERRHVAAGDAILIPPGGRHTLANDGAAPLRILCCCSPPYSDDDTYFS
jgi:mannose-6-phosphate isomerase-like protein (cupin superfamily)